MRERDPPARARPTRTRETRKTRDTSAENSRNFSCACKQSLFCLQTRLMVKPKKMTQPFPWRVLASLTPRKYFTRFIFFAISETIRFYDITLVYSQVIIDEFIEIVSSNSVVCICSKDRLSSIETVKPCHTHTFPCFQNVSI